MAQAAMECRFAQAAPLGMGASHGVKSKGGRGVGIQVLRRLTSCRVSASACHSHWSLALPQQLSDAICAGCCPHACTCTRQPKGLSVGATNRAGSCMHHAGALEPSWHVHPLLLLLLQVGPLEVEVCVSHVLDLEGRVVDAQVGALHPHAAPPHAWRGRASTGTRT
jgi:hypothetical protein